MAPTPPTNPKAHKSTEGSSAVKASNPGKSGGKVDSPVKSGRDEMMRVAAARSPPSKAPSATDVTIQKCVTGTSELVSVTVFNGTFPAHQFLADRRNFFDINGKRFEKCPGFFTFNPRPICICNRSPVLPKHYGASNCPSTAF